MGIVRRDPQHLLDDAEQNIGNSAIIPPQVGPLGPTSNAGTIYPDTNPPRIIQLSGPSKKGQTTSVAMTASRIAKSPQNPNPGFAGPITGIVDFGNGGRSTRVEFDIPIGPFVGSLTAVASASEPQDGGVIVTLPTGVLRAYARCDNLLITPALNTNLALAQIAGADFIGPGGPVSFPVPAPNNFAYAEPVLAKAMAAYFSRHTSQVYKTMYLYVGALGGAGKIAVPVISNGGAVSYCLPAFARSVKVLRLPLTAALNCWFSDGINDIDQFAVVSGASAPIVPVIGHEIIINIQSASALPADDVNFLALVCEIGI